MDLRGPQASPVEVVASSDVVSVPATSARRPPSGASMSNGGSCRGTKDNPSNVAAVRSSEAGTKGTARLQSLRLQGGAGDATNSIVITAVRQLEQRLESERRHTERQLQRLERQVEELTNVPPSGGRWAELQGYVDGLAETVQNLVRRTEEPTFAAKSAAESAPACSIVDSAPLAALTRRVDGVETRQVASDKSRENVSDQLQRLGDRHLTLENVVSETTSYLEELGARLLDVEQGVARVSQAVNASAEASAPRFSQSAVVEDNSSAIDCDRRLVHRGQRGSSENKKKLEVRQALLERFDPDDDDKSRQQAADTARNFECIYEELSDFAERLEAAECAIAAGPAHEEWLSGAPHPTSGHCTPLGEAVDNQDEDHGSATVEIGCREFGEQDLQEQVDDLQNQFDEQIGALQEHLQELETRMQDTESGLQEVQLDQDVRQEATHVGDQVLRLAMRMQRLERNGIGASGMDVEEMHELRSELSHFSEQLLHLASRLSHAERGLTGAAEAISRVCEEVAQIRSQQTPAREDIGDSIEQASSQNLHSEQASRQASKSADEPASPPEPLQHKVGEIERSLETMADVVWELKKQVAGLRTNFATLQSSVLGHEAPDNGAHGSNVSPSGTAPVE